MESIVVLLEEISSNSPVVTALVMSSIAMTLTTLGGLGAVLLKNKFTPENFAKMLDLGLGFSSGVMLVASFTSLLIPSIDSFGIAPTLLGFILGALTIHIVNNLIPHEHFVRGYEGPPSGLRKLKAAWLVAFAIIIHNFPEGISIGAASAYSTLNGITIGLAIGIQDIPEGLAVSLPVYASTGRLGWALFLAWLSGLSEVVMAVPAAYLSAISLPLLPYAMGFGAGAMVYVVSHEAIPETHRSGHEDLATLSFFLGFITMLLLDSILG
ncbi:MAG: ZIP family metal transporter [Desulfurococcales archaeon]|nr:ZIP family metal transporter [Desulfurococcales archaeon]